MKVRTRKTSSGVLWESEYNPFHSSAVTPDSGTALATWVGSSPEYECPAAQAVPQNQHKQNAQKPGVQLSKKSFYKKRVKNE